MRNKFTRILAVVAFVAAGIFTNYTTKAAERNVVVEDHTGAWCGYCVRGTGTLEELEAQYGDDLIGVAVHNTSQGRPDNMAIPNYENPLAQMIGLTGFPSGSVNRIPYNGVMALSDSYWPMRAQALVNQQVPVGVSLEVTYDKTTGDYSVTVTANVESQINDQLAMNLWILEDRVVGQGSGWDQHNYLSKTGGAADPNSKWYDLPPVIQGFVHNNVFRHATGGIDGDITPFTAVPVAPGTYTKTYTGNVSQYNIKDKANVFFVGLVQNTATKEIINAERVGKVVPDVDVLATAVDNPYVTLADNNKKEVEVTLKNEKDWTVTANLSVNTGSSLVPSGWGLTLSNNSITVNANSTRTIKLEVLKNNIEGYGEITIDVKPEKSNPDNIVSNSTAKVYIMTENIENAYFIGYDAAAVPILTTINNSNVLTKVTPISADPDVVSHFPQMANFKTAIFNALNAIAFSSTETKANLDLINTLMNNGCDILITGNFDFINSGNKFSDVSPTPEASSFFSNKLGITLTGFFNLVQNQQLYSLPITGIAGDDISSGITFNSNQAYNGSTYPYYARLASSFSLNGNSSATSFLEISNPTSVGLTGTTNKVGIKLDNDGQRTVFVSIPLSPVVNPTRDLLYKNILTWLKGGGTQVAGPKISLNVNQLDFGKVTVNDYKSKTIAITNEGDQALNISAINFKYGDYFSVQNASLPLVVDAGQTVNLTIKFAPTEGVSYQDEVTIVSNDAANPSTVVALSGNGDEPTGVPGVISDVFEMNVTPNPVVDNSVLKFTSLKGSLSTNIDLIDATGKVVSHLYNGATTGATVGLNAGQLSSGTYFIRANVDGKTTQLPIVIAK